MFLCCIFISCSRIKINSFYNIIFTETRFITLEKECDVKKILMPGKAIRHTCPKSTGDLGRTLRLISSFSMQVSQSLLRGKQNIIRPIFQCSTTQRHIYNNQCQPDHISDLCLHFLDGQLGLCFVQVFSLKGGQPQGLLDMSQPLVCLPW